MYYLIYDPSDGQYRQSHWPEIGNSSATLWSYTIPFWDIYKHSYATLDTPSYETRCAILLSSEHPITATSHPELLL